MYLLLISININVPRLKQMLNYTVQHNETFRNEMKLFITIVGKHTFHSI
jgi:hypothetical protein